MPKFSIEGRLGIFKGLSNISSNKYDILILPGTLFIRSIPSFKGITVRGSVHWRNGLLAEHREHSHYCQDFDNMLERVKTKHDREMRIFCSGFLVFKIIS